MIEIENKDDNNNYNQFNGDQFDDKELAEADEDKDDGNGDTRNGKEIENEGNTDNGNEFDGKEAATVDGYKDDGDANGTINGKEIENEGDNYNYNKFNDNKFDDNTIDSKEVKVVDKDKYGNDNDDGASEIQEEEEGNKDGNDDNINEKINKTEELSASNSCNTNKDMDINVREDEHTQ